MLSGLLFRYALLVAAAAMSGVTAFNVSPASPAPDPSDLSFPEGLLNSVLGPEEIEAEFLPRVGYIENLLLADKSFMRSMSSPPTPSKENVSLAFAGDVLIHGNVRGRALVGNNTYDFTPMFDPVAPVISAADLAICHLEVPLSPDNTELSTYPRFNAPRETATALAEAGFDGCSTASNHSIDKGAAGLIATLDILDEAGLGHAGTARTPEEAAAATFYETAGPTVAHIAATYWLNGLGTPEGKEWMAQRIDVAAILEMAWGARREGADLVVVSIHCCTEYRSEPTSDQVELFEELIENPWVDLVVGHHSHVVGPVAEIDGEYVIYGLGNLVSGQTHRQDAREGVVAIVDAAWDGRRWRVTGVGAVPTFVEGRTYAIVPQAPGSPAAERTMSALGAYGVPVTQRLVEDINDPA